MSLKKTLCSILAGIMLAGSVSSCTLKSPTMPKQRTVTANATMFANTGVSYTLSSPDGTDIEWKRPCDTGYTKGVIVPMLNGCYGNLEVRVNGVDANDLVIRKDELTTDIEVKNSLDQKVTEGKVNSNYVTNIYELGYEWDAIFQRLSDGKWIYVWAVGKNEEENIPNWEYSIPFDSDYVLVMP